MSSKPNSTYHSSIYAPFAVAIGGASKSNIPSAYGESYMRMELYKGLPKMAQYEDLAQELGGDFHYLAPRMYEEYCEMLAIVNYRKANNLLGIDNE